MDEICRSFFQVLRIKMWKYVLKAGIGISVLFCFNFITENISKFRIKEVKVLDKSLYFMEIIIHQNFACLQVLIYKLTMYTSLLVFNNQHCTNPSSLNLHIWQQQQQQNMR